MEIQELAKHARTFFKTFRRPEDPEGVGHYTLKDPHPIWIEEMSRAVHDDSQWLPDDYKYEYMVQALDSLEEGNDPEEPYIEADVYNSDLLDWLASHSYRAEFVNEAVKDMGHSENGIIGDIGTGQYAEKREVWDRVLQALRDRLQAIEDGEPEAYEEKKKPKGEKKQDWRPPPRA